MTNSYVVKLCWFVVGLVVGGAVTVGVFMLLLRTTKSDEASNNDEDATNSTGPRTINSLQFIVVVSRHGNRGGSADYPFDPYSLSNTTYWPYGANGLTEYGRVQEYELGMKLRELYDGFLPASFYPQDIHASTDLVERVMMSGELVLAGLYPPLDWQVWNSSVLWQPIPLYTSSPDHSEDIASCQRFQLEKASARLTFLEKEAATISAMRSYIYNETGDNFTVGDLYFMFDKIISEVTEGYVLPDWTKALYPDPLSEFAAEYYWACFAGTDEMVRLYIGDLLEEMMASMTSKVSGLSDKLLVYYSAHDSTVLTLQAALGVANDTLVKLVKTGSALVIELHKDSNSKEYYIEVLYLDGSSLDSGLVSLSLPDCGDPCYFDSLVNSTQRFTNISYEDECQTLHTTILDYSLHTFQ